MFFLFEKLNPPKYSKKNLKHFESSIVLTTYAS